LIEVYSDGDTNEHVQQPGLPLANVPIAEVHLDVIGGVLDGRAQSEPTGGWDIGIYTNSTFGTVNANDYQSGYEVSASSVDIQNFHLAGIYATIDANSRGVVELDDVTVESIGQEAPSSPADFAQSGIHASASDGYFYLDASDTTVTNCVGNGILMHVPESQSYYEMTWPVGGLLKLDERELYLNDRHGLELAGNAYYLNDPLLGSIGGSAIVGGTIDRIGTIPSMVYYPTKVGQPPVHGEGLVENTSIYENGESGIEVALADEGGGTNYNAVNVRFVNSYVFDNSGEGYRADLVIPSANNAFESRTYLLTAFVHCTFALNGGSNDFSVELLKNTTDDPKFEWRSDDPYVSLPSRELPKTAFVNSIFERPNSTHADFNSTIEDLLESDDISGETSIGTSGCRFELFNTGSTTGTAWTSDVTPFTYLSNSLLVGRERYYLDPLGALINSFEDNTSALLKVYSPESSNDIVSTTRPLPSTTNRDKGGFEIN